MSKTNEARLDGLFQTMLDDLTSSLMQGENLAAQRLMIRMRKRAEYLRPSLNELALTNFKILNETVGATKVRLDDDLIQNARHFITVNFENFNTKINEANIQEHLDMSYLMSLWRFGPGASNGVSGTHCADKIYQNMTCTESAAPLVSYLRSSNPYFSAFDAKNGSLGYDLYSGSKLTTVPKNEDTVRVIAIEPSGNMALQLAAGQYITNVLTHIGLDISNQQEKNKLLAKRGSIDGSLATIDLKSASDMFTPELIRLLLPSKWFELLMKIRSPETMVGNESVKLNMISTMGNGFTFPLMTLCLVSLIYALRCRHNGPTLYISWVNTAVFGDDIIVPSSEYDELTQIIEAAGLIVNHDKSYSVGPFRESCGGDYNLGVDITPFYVRSLSSDPEIYVALNQVLEWSSKHCYLPRTAQYLFKLLDKVLFVPEWSNPDQGILTSQVERRYKFLQPVAHQVKLEDQFFLMPLAVGGYVFSQGPDVLYTPRQYKTRYVVRRGRLPTGYLSGHDPLKRSISNSAKIDLFVSLLG